MIEWIGMDKHLPHGFNMVQLASINPIETKMVQLWWWSAVWVVTTWIVGAVFWSGFYPGRKWEARAVCHSFGSSSTWNLKLCFADSHQHGSFSLATLSVAATASVGRRPFQQGVIIKLRFLPSWYHRESYISTCQKAKLVCPAQAIPISWMTILALLR